MILLIATIIEKYFSAQLNAKFHKLCVVKEEDFILWRMLQNKICEGVIY